jgi:Icc-related predicted phosphoesterase
MGDLHVTDESHGRYRELFAEISDVADVVCLCGDLTNYGKLDEAEVLAADLRTLRIPAVGVLGNHDHECGKQVEVAHILKDAGLHILDGEAYEFHGVGFGGCMGAMGGFGRFMLSGFGEAPVKTFVQSMAEEALKLENSLRMLRTDRVVTVLHYAPVPDTLKGEPIEIFPFLGSSRMGETVDRYDNVAAVVHGHAHKGCYYGRTPRGTPVYNCAQFVVREEFGRPYAMLEI